MMDWLEDDEEAFEIYTRDINWSKIEEEFKNIGYKDGVAIGKEKGLQLGFDEGLISGKRFGILIGQIYGVTRSFKQLIAIQGGYEDVISKLNEIEKQVDNIKSKVDDKIEETDETKSIENELNELYLKAKTLVENS